MQLFKGEFEGKVETGYRRKDGTPVKDIANATRKLRSPQEQLEDEIVRIERDEERKAQANKEVTSNNAGDAN